MDTEILQIAHIPMETSLVCVFGVSGVGKTTLMNQYVADHPSWAILSASKIVAEDLGKDPERMRIAPPEVVIENQHEIAAAIRARRSKEPATNFLLDAHAVIDRGDSLVEVGPGVVQELLPDGIIVVVDTPAAIVRRRTSDRLRVRPIRSAQEIAAQQSLTLALCAEYALCSGVQSTTVQAGETIAFESAVSRVQRTRSEK